MKKRDEGFLNVISIKNKIIKSDADNFLKKIPNNFIDLVVTDPPYGIGISSWDHKAPTGWCSEIPRILKENGSLLVFCGKQNRFEVEKALRESGLYFWQELIWIYGNGGITRKSSYNGHHEPILWFVKDQTKFKFNIKGNLWIDTWTVIDRARPQRNFKKDKKIHPTQKALEVVKKLIEEHSNPDDIVLDCFMGSGTTAVACKQLGRNFIGFEISPEYCKIANKRLAQNTLNQLKSEGISPPNPKGMGIQNAKLI
ncbi:MAG: site-specific DNA-methyltransferase [archaeon]